MAQQAFEGSLTLCIAAVYYSLLSDDFQLSLSCPLHHAFSKATKMSSYRMHDNTLHADYGSGRQPCHQTPVPLPLSRCYIDILPLVKHWQQAELVAWSMQDKCGLPWVVGLDLTGTDTDMLNLAPALAVKRLDPPEDPEDPADPQAAPQSFYLCLLADNRSFLLCSTLCTVIKCIAQVHV